MHIKDLIWGKPAIAFLYIMRLDLLSCHTHNFSNSRGVPGDMCCMPVSYVPATLRHALLVLCPDHFPLKGARLIHCLLYTASYLPTSNPTVKRCKLPFVYLHAAACRTES